MSEVEELYRRAKSDRNYVDKVHGSIYRKMECNDANVDCISKYNDDMMKKDRMYNKKDGESSFSIRMILVLLILSIAFFLKQNHLLLNNEFYQAAMYQLQQTEEIPLPDFLKK